MPKLPKKQADIKELPSKRAKVKAKNSLEIAQFILSCVVTGAVVGILLTIIAMR